MAAGALERAQAVAAGQSGAYGPLQVRVCNTLIT
jgi:hypothetical protein